MVAGQEISGAGLPNGATIASIVNGTQITVALPLGVSNTAITAASGNLTATYQGTAGTLTGGINVDQAGLIVSTQYGAGGSLTNPYASGDQINLYGGIYQPNAATIFLNPVVANNSTTITPAANSMFQSLTINGLAVAPQGTDGSVTSTGTIVTTTAQLVALVGNLTVNGNAILNVGAQNMQVGGMTLGSGYAGTTYNGGAGLSGTGNLDKWGAGTLAILGSSTGYSGNINVWQGVLQFQDGIATANGYGSGNITVQPGGILLLAASGNIGGTLTINSDEAALGVLDLLYSGSSASVPAATWKQNNGPFDGVLGH